MPPLAGNNANNNNQLVVCPDDKPSGTTYFDWDDSKLKKWKKEAISLQDAHVRDNNRTRWFTHNSLIDQDALELRILMAIFGLRTPQVIKHLCALLFMLTWSFYCQAPFLNIFLSCLKDKTNGPFSPLRSYNRLERKTAKSLMKKIVNKSKNTTEICMNVVYISTATKIEGNEENEFYASEVPCKQDY